MISFRFLLLVGTAIATSAGAAAAQQPTPVRPQSAPQTTQTPAPPPAQEPAEEPAQEDKSDAVEDVVVQGRQTDVRTSIDSISYSLAEDLQAATGTLADALRNVPSVDVDPQGNVSLRGDSSVTILVDGRPSGVLTGEGRAQALLQLPADRYARIEVMTNPSAAYSPEGSGGVINLITKPTTVRPGLVTTGSVRANVGPDGRWNLGVSGSWARDKLTLSGDLSARMDSNSPEFTRVREGLDPVTGAVISTTTSDQGVEMDQNGAFGRFSAEYKLTDRTQLTGELRGVAFGGDGVSPSLFQTRNASGVVTSAYRRDGTMSFDFANWGATARLLHRFDDAGHEWSNELRYESNGNESTGLTVNRFITPVAPEFFERSEQELDQVTRGFTSAYVRPTADGGRLRAGYEVNQQRPNQDVKLLRGPTEGALVLVPGLSNRFEASQTVQALYGTYERPLTEKLSAQAGLRLEQADIEIDDLTGGASASQDYFRAYPTAHLQYQLSDAQTLRASYSRRIQRPQLGQLNPFVSFQDPLNLRSGNPDLEPQETDAFEAMWQMRAGQTFYQATAYLRDTDKAFTDVAVDLGGGVLLTRPENLGSRRDMGVEFVANGRLHPTLRYNASLNVFQQEIDAAGIPGAQDQSGTVVSGRASLNWQPTSADFLQISGLWQGDQLLAQGTREAGGMVNLGYRRTLTEKLAFQATVRDVFDSFGDITTFETATFRDRSERRFGGRAWYLGLTYAFGQGPRRPQEPQFDFSAPAPGG